ncbi:MAG TPA: hypothetical protein VGR71_05435 [Nitrospira sp.]|nr:hypothetical protein [Nitrospira sp.]
MTGKEVLGPTDTRGWFERDAAEPVQDPAAAPAAEFEPHLIAEESGKDRCQDGHA